MATTDAQLADLLTRNASLFTALENRSNTETALLAGTIDDPDSFDRTGGKTGALGYYPVVNASGQIVYKPCQARLEAIAAGGVDPAALDALLARQAGVATTAAGAATAAAGSAATARDAVLLDPGYQVVSKDLLLGSSSLVAMVASGVLNLQAVAASAQTATAAATATAADRVQTAASATAARQAVTDAQLARDAAALAGRLYADEPTGRAAVADGAYFSVRGDGTSTFATLYQRVSASVASTLIATYPSKNYVDTSLGALSGIAAYVSPASRLYGLRTVAVGKAAFAAGSAATIFTATRDCTVSSLTAYIRAIGSGAANLIVATGTAPNYTFLSSIPLAAPTVAGANTTWALTLSLKAGQTLLLGTPAGGVQFDRTAKAGCSNYYFIATPFTAGTVAFSTVADSTLTVQLTVSASTAALPRDTFATDDRKAIGATSALLADAPAIVGALGTLGSSLTFAADAMGWVGQAPADGPLDSVTTNIKTLGSGAATLAIATGTAPVFTIKQQIDLPAATATGAKTWTAADFGAIDLREGDHILIGSPAGGIVQANAAVTGSASYYVLTGTPAYGPVTFTYAADRRFQARFGMTRKVISGLAPSTAPQTFVIFAVGGQSNSVGRGTAGPAIFAGAAYQYFGGALTAITGDPVGSANTGSAWPAFAAEFFRRTGKGVIFVPGGKDGTTMTAPADHGVGNWSATGSLRGALASNVAAAKAAATAAGIAWQFGGVLWSQGESDGDSIAGTAGGSSSVTTIDQYKAGFEVLLSYFEGQTGHVAGIMPWIIARTGVRADGLTPEAYGQVRDAQDGFCRAHSNVFMGWTGAVNAQVRGQMNTTFHYNQLLLDEMGASMATVAAAVAIGRM